MINWLCHERLSVIQCVFRDMNKHENIINMLGCDGQKHVNESKTKSNWTKIVTWASNQCLQARNAINLYKNWTWEQKQPQKKVQLQTKFFFCSHFYIKKKLLFFIIHLKIDDFDVDWLDHDKSKFSPLRRSRLISNCAFTSSLGLNVFFKDRIKNRGNKAIAGVMRIIR